MVFFTLEYPYGKKSETFIENEIKYLADTFERVIIIPRERKDDEIRILPHNVEINTLLINSKKLDNHFKYIYSSFSRLMAVANIYLYTVFNDKHRKYYFSSGYFIYYVANALKEAKLLEAFINREKLDNAVFYDYWFVNTTFSLSYLKSKDKIKNLLCRAHGFDVFNERWACGTVPFREYILKHINAVYAISNYNQTYIKKQLNSHKEKVQVAYLGVRQMEVNTNFNSKISINRPFLIVSCANLFPFKQIKKIAEVLKLIDIDHQLIKWVHFGDGPEEIEILKAAKELPDTVSFDYKGHVKNEEVLEFYVKNDVDLFISLSLKEGLPVSMMEAQSFGVPIMAYSIFGIPEIVTNKTGVLLQESDSEIEIAEQLTKILKQEIVFDKAQIKQFFNIHFSAEHNFKAFTQNLIQYNA